MRRNRKNAKTRARYCGLTNADGAFNGLVRFMEDDLGKPLRTRKPTVYSIWNELFHADVADAQRDRAFAVMAHSPIHQFIVLTKRPKLLREYFARLNKRRRGYWHEHCGYLADVAIRAGLLSEEASSQRYDEARRRFHPDLPGEPKSVGDSSLYNPGWPLPNVGLGVTVGHPDSTWRLEELLNCPAAMRFVSCEPLLEELTLCTCASHITPIGWHTPECPLYGGGGISDAPRNLDCLIIGPETGRDRRPCKPQWIESLIGQADDAGLPVFVKAFPLALGGISKNIDVWPPYARRREFPDWR